MTGDWSQVVLITLQIAWFFFQYFWKKGEEKAAAAKALADLFTKLEKQGYPIMRDLLTQMGRSSWIPWDQIPSQPLNGPGQGGSTGNVSPPK